MPSATRRTFIKTAVAGAAALLVPTWEPLITRVPFDLTDFCDKDAWGGRRYDMSKPFAQTDFTYATDGRACVRTDLIKPDLEAPEKRTPDAAGLPWDHAIIDNWQKWPQESWIQYQSRYGAPCPYCQGHQPKDALDCATCYGTGAGLDECSECGDCSGRGWHGTLCDYCGGTGGINGKPAVQVVGGLKISGYYDRKIRRLDCPEFSIRPVVRASEKDLQVIAFRFNGGEGLVMPLMADA